MARSVSRVRTRTPNTLEKSLKKAKVPFRTAFMSAKWGADQKDSRQLIRKKIFALIKNPLVLEFSTVSKCDDVYFSIAHTDHIGALITAKQPIGIDLEHNERALSTKALNRLATPAEQSLGLTAIELWAAKEAAFKASQACTGVGLIRTISEINIRGAKKNISKKTFDFSFIPNKNNGLAIQGQGCVLTLKETTLAITWIKA